MPTFLSSSLRIRLLLLIFAAMLPMFAFTLYTASRERQTETLHAQDEALHLAKSVSIDQERLIDAVRQLLVTLSGIGEFKRCDTRICGALFSGLLEEFPAYSNLVAADVEGDVLASAVLLAAPVSLASEPWFQRAVQNRRFAFGECAADPVTGEPVIAFAYPVLSADAGVVSVLCASLNLQRWIKQTLLKVQFPQGAVLTILQDGGKIAARYPEPEKWVGKMMPESSVVELILAEGTGVAEARDTNGLESIHGFVPLPHAPERIYVNVSLDKKTVLARANRRLQDNLLLLALTTVLALAAALITADFLVLRKTVPLMDAAKLLASGDLTARTGLHYGGSELEELARTFDEMAEYLERRQIEAEQLEEVLRESGRRMRAIFNHAFQMTGILKPDGTLLEVNQTALDFCGVSHSDVFGQSFWETPWWRVSRETQRRLRDSILEAANGNTVRYEAEHRGRGEELAVVDFSLKPLKDESGRVLFLIAEGRDITERKQVERALRESEARYRAIVEDQTELIVRFLPDEKLTFANEAYCRFHGEPRENLIGRAFWHSIHPEDRERFKEQVASLDRANAVVEIEHRVLTVSGEMRWLQWTDRALFDQEGQLIEYQAVGRDVTARKNAEQSLRESETQLRCLSARLLTAQEDERKRISRELHDSIGQSLTIVKFAVESVLSHTSGGLCLPDPARKPLEALVPMIQCAMDDLRKIMSVLRPSILDDLGIIATIGWFCREFQNVYTAIQIEKEIGIEEHEIPGPLKIVIFRIIQEALNNVAKYSGASLVDISLKRTDGSMELVIEDDGIGFNPDEVFTGGDGKRGFGLSSMRERAEFSGGHFTIQSARGYGTRIGAIWPTRGPVCGSYGT